jgi:hypothetical protein
MWTTFYICIIVIDRIKLSEGCSSNAPIATAMDIWNIIDIRSYPKGRRLNIFNFISNITKLVNCRVVPRSVDYNGVTTPAFPFVRSMGPQTRNVYSRFTRKYAKRAQIHPFWPHGHSMPPRSKNR